MDFEKIRTDFEKRYEMKCERTYFVGKSITLFSGNALTVSGCLSVGEAMAVARREDDRLVVEFSDADNMISFSISEMENYRDYRLVKLLTEAKKCGIKLGGANVFVFRNSQITNLLEPLFLGCMSSFCKNVPPKEKLLPRFENFGENSKVLSGKQGCITIFDGQRTANIPFLRGEYKTVIAYSGRDPVAKRSSEISFAEDGILALKRGDAEKFGCLLTRESRNIMKENKFENSRGLFESACCMSDCLGSGVVDGGGIFSFVENSKVDSFVHDVTSHYKKHFGGTPDFYITDFADSGVFVDVN